MMSLSIWVSGCSLPAINSCDWAKPVRPWVGDDLKAAPGLAREALAHNLAGAENCGWKP